MMITRETVDLKGFDYNLGQIILVDKPLNWTSFKVVALIRKHCGAKKVGHSGTLDPLATGLLIICTGRKTKELQKFIGLKKTYTGTFILGKYSRTFDLEHETKDIPIPDNVNSNKIKEVRDRFVGEIFQTPPMFSAKKIKGKRLYNIARKNKIISVEPRKVTIYEFEINSIQLPVIEFKITCSKGTYIRSIADEFGKHLNTSAVLGSLRRIKIGDYNIEDAISVEDFVKRFTLAESPNMVNN